MTNISQIGIEVDGLVLELKGLIDKFKLADGLIPDVEKMKEAAPFKVL